MLENKLGITNSAELAREEERISKTKASVMFESGFLDTLEAGTVSTLCEIHRFLFCDIYDLRESCGRSISQRENFALLRSCILKMRWRQWKRCPRAALMR